MPFIDTLAVILTTAYILFAFALGLWAGLIYMRGGALSGQFWGAVWTCTGLAAAALIVWLLRILAGETLRWVYFLYALYFVIVLPGTFSLLRGRDDRNAAGIFAAVAVFSALAAISATDPTRGVVVLPPITPTP